MQIAGRRWHAAALAACLLVALAFGAVAAFAAGSWWTSGDNNSLTVNAASESADFKTDLDKANVVVDVYKIADAEADDAYQTFNYTLTGAFAEDPSISIPAEAERDADSWQALAEAARGLITVGSGATATGTAGQPITGLEDGLYLVLAHGAGQSDLVAFTDGFEYSFPPTVVALPSKNDVDGSGAATSAQSDGAWLTDVTISMKPEQEPRYGDIRIIKRVQGFFGTPATFVFHLKSTDDSPYEYDNYASVYYTGGESAYTDVKHIQAGTILTVTEEQGNGFELVSGDTSAKTIVAKAENAAEDAVPEVSVTYVNKATGKPAHGIENTYTLVDDGAEGGEWEWHAVPDSNAQSGQATED